MPFAWRLAVGAFARCRERLAASLTKSRFAHGMNRSDFRLIRQDVLMTLPPRQSYMEMALAEARLAEARGEVPIGAVIVNSAGVIIGRGGNRTRERNDPTAHAEIVAIRAACQVLQSERLPGCDLYVTLEPCPMCAAAVSFARVRRLYFGAMDAKGGGVEHGARIFNQPTCHHAPEIYGGLAETEAALLLRAFFSTKRVD